MYKQHLGRAVQQGKNGNKPKNFKIKFTSFSNFLTFFSIKILITLAWTALLVYVVPLKEYTAQKGLPHHTTYCFLGFLKYKFSEDVSQIHCPINTIYHMQCVTDDYMFWKN
jgi:hypothetical protein